MTAQQPESDNFGPAPPRLDTYLSSRGISLRYGRVHVPDARDRKYRLRVSASARTSRYWRDDQWTGDQGDRSSCVGFAWKAYLTSSPVSQLKRLDPDGLYELCKHRDEWQGESYEGTSVRAGADVLKTLGLLSEYRWATTLDAVVNAVLELGPMVVGTDWHEGMEEPDSEGVIHLTGDVLGGHAYLLTGVNTRRQLFRIRNSWGDDWGQSGRAWLSFADFRKLLRADGEACRATEVKV